MGGLEKNNSYPETKTEKPETIDKTRVQTEKDQAKAKLRELKTQTKENMDNIKQLKEKLNGKMIPPEKTIEFTITKQGKPFEGRIEYKGEDKGFFYNGKKLKYSIQNISFNENNINVKVYGFNYSYSYEDFYKKIIDKKSTG